MALDETTLLSWLWNAAVAIAVAATGLFAKLLHTRIDGVKDDTAHAKSSIDDLWRRHDEKLQRITRIEARVDSAEKTSDDRQRSIDARLDRIEKKLDSALSRRAEDSGA